MANECGLCHGSRRDLEDPSFPCAACFAGPRARSNSWAAPAPKPRQLGILDILEDACYAESQATKESPVGITDIMSLGESAPVAAAPKKFPPTLEQQACVDAFTTGGDVLIEALAGTGKTTTLKMLANSAPQRKGLYLCYNRASADEAKADFPSSVKCSTAHALAFGVTGIKYKNRLNADRVPPWEIATWLGVHNNFYVNADVSLVPMAVAGRVMDTVRRFCYSADSEISAKHVPYIAGVEDYRPKVERYLVPLARKAWADLNAPVGFLKGTHDVYLKQFVMSNPTLNYDYIAVDEFQDSNPLVSQLVEMQRGNTQLVVVGDRYQSLYRWRGAVDALSTFKADHHLYLSKSFRFGPAVAAEANRWLVLLGAKMRLEGFDKIASKVEPLSDPDAILCRTNAEAIGEIIVAQERGLSVAFAGGTAEIEKFVKGAQDLQRGKRTLHPDLAAFETWASVEEYSLTPEGADLRVFVKLIEQHTAEKLMRVASSTVPEEAADIVISTGHKSKGREWGRVRIGNDYSGLVNEDGNISEEGMMLSYVSVTRAKNVLDRGGLSFIDELEMNA